MADVVDTANEKADILLAASVARQQLAQAKDRIEPTGRCHWCDEITNDTALFCTSECRDDYDRQARAKARNGRDE